MYITNAASVSILIKHIECNAWFAMWFSQWVCWPSRNHVYFISAECLSTFESHLKRTLLMQSMCWFGIVELVVDMTYLTNTYRRAVLCFQVTHWRASGLFGLLFWQILAMCVHWLDNFPWSYWFWNKCKWVTKRELASLGSNCAWLDWDRREIKWERMHCV